MLSNCHFLSQTVKHHLPVSAFILPAEILICCYKIYNPVRQSQFGSWRDLHNISRRFEDVGALRSALYHELEEDIPDSGDYEY